MLLYRCSVQTPGPKKQYQTRVQRNTMRNHAPGSKYMHLRSRVDLSVLASLLAQSHATDLASQIG